MKTDDFTYLLKNPQAIKPQQIIGLKMIIDKYPYFQSARALYLKGLKDQESFKYNNELKVVAAHTTDRTVLFNFISSKIFNLPSKTVLPKKNLSEKTPKEPLKIAQELAIGKPIAFSSNERYSFGEWLQLSNQKTIVRKKETNKKEGIINKFIRQNPKITPVSKHTSPVLTASKIQKKTELMTETLARVYLEQKKYKEAIKAYKVLSLKYPEKSGFFADQIKKIQLLQTK